MVADRIFKRTVLTGRTGVGVKHGLFRTVLVPVVEEQVISFNNPFMEKPIGKQWRKMTFDDAALLQDLGKLNVKYKYIGSGQTDKAGPR